MDTLERERVLDNILDRMDRLTERILRLEERMRAEETMTDLELDGTLTADRIVLRVDETRSVILAALVLRDAPKLEMILYETAAEMEEA